MALKGTLEDMAIIDLIQFPHTGRKTGHLLLRGNDGEAALYYEKGALVHAQLEDLSGMEALVRVVDWVEGSFEFMPDAEPEARSIEMDLHRAVMQALKLRDESKMEEERRMRDSSLQERDEGQLSNSLSQYIGSNDFALHACVLSSDGELRAEVSGPDGNPDGIESLRSSLYELKQTHPRGALSRVLIEDNHGTVAMVGLADGGCLIIMASGDASLGSVSMSAGKLAKGIS